MTEIELFMDWAGPAGFTLDHLFMASGGVPENPFEDRDTKMAFDIWLASRKAVRTEELSFCAGHADAWFTGRNHLPGDQSCVVCAFQAPLVGGKPWPWTDAEMADIIGFTVPRLESRCDANKNFAIGEFFGRELIALLKECERRFSTTVSPKHLSRRSHELHARKSKHLSAETTRERP